MSETTIYKEGFNAGFMQLRQIDVEAATKELWQALGINNRNTFAAWKVGRNCMKDWRAAVRTWERNEKGNSGNGRKGQQTGAATGRLGAVPGGTSKKKYTDTL